MKIFYILAFIIHFQLLIGPAWASQVVIKSQPEGAEVIVQVAQGGKKTKIGTTPLTIPHAQLDTITQGVAYKIEVIKPGFEVYRLLVAATNMEEITLSAVLEPSIEVKLGASTDVLVTGLFEAQRLTRAQDYDGALLKLAELEKAYASVSSVFELRGSVNYLKKDFTTALAEFRKAYTLNPQNEVAQRMKDYLETKMGSGAEQ
jgi:hypothetical protein